MSLTFRHFLNARISKSTMTIHDDNFFQIPNGHVTLEYPHEKIAVPDNGRYQLDCEIDDCIVCDKCAKVCPVDCIEIEAIKSPELIRTTSDGSPVRLHAAKFDIDMAKCCFCGLCTTVCPTECLTMNSEYDYSTIDITNLNFAFSNLSTEEAQEKKELYEQFVAEKEAMKPQAQTPSGAGFRPSMAPKPSGSKPSFVPNKPILKPKDKSNLVGEEETPTYQPASRPKPFIPQKPKSASVDESKVSGDEVKKGFVPVLKPKETSNSFKPTIRPKTQSEEAVKKPFSPTLKPQTPTGFKPSIKPKKNEKGESGVEENVLSKPSGFKPTLKPKTNETVNDEVKKATFTPSLKPKNQEKKVEAEENKKLTKPVFRPTIKPKKKD